MWLFLVSLVHIQNNLPYITDKFPKQDGMVLFLTSPAANMTDMDTLNQKILSRN